MFDAKKALDGVPGLLVMAACGLVGVAVGFSLALSTEYWIKASDGLANFWGGVVGAGLGAALAVLGAVYVQRLERRDRLEAPVNLLRYHASQLRASLRTVRDGLVASTAPSISTEKDREAVHRFIELVQTEVEKLPSGEELSPEIHDELQSLRALVSFMLSRLDADITNATLDETAWMRPTYQKTLDDASERLERLLTLTKAL